MNPPKNAKISTNPPPVRCPRGSSLSGSESTCYRSISDITGFRNQPSARVIFGSKCTIRSLDIAREGYAHPDSVAGCRRASLGAPA
jgi:hypothetical protein